MVTTSRGKSLYRGMTLGLRKRFANGHQFEVNYVLAKDEDDDSNERDPFVDYSFNVHDLSLDYGPSARDVRHKFNAFGYFEIRGFELNTRVQARSAQPITPNPRVLNGTDRAATRSARTTNLLVRLAPGLPHLVRRRPISADPGCRDVQYLQQQEQHQSARRRRSSTSPASYGRAWAIRGKCSWPSSSCSRRGHGGCVGPATGIAGPTSLRSKVPGFALFLTLRRDVLEDPGFVTNCHQQPAAAGRSSAYPIGLN